ncbi:MAG: DUF2723 domain-containing protein, partial [Chloroflexota bacterium]
PTWRIAHPTGYPLYTLLGTVWSRVLFPIGNWAWRMNTLSALFGATAVMLLFLVAKKLFSPKHKTAQFHAALATTTIFAISPTWWQQSTIAEVYTLHILLTTLILYLTISGSAGQWVSGSAGQPVSQSASQPVSQPDSHPIPIAFLLGLSLTHHRTAIFLIPPIGLYLLWHNPNLRKIRQTWRLWMQCLLAFITPLSLYLLIPIQASMGNIDLNRSYVDTWQGFWDHVLARRYQTFLQDNPLAIERTLADWWQMFHAEFGWMGMALCIIGLIAVLKLCMRGIWFRDDMRTVANWLLILVFTLLNAIFAFNYQVADTESFLLPVFLGMSLFVGMGVYAISSTTLQGWSTGNESVDRRPSLLGRLAYLCILILVVLPVALPTAKTTRTLRHNWAIHDYAVAMAKVDYPPSSHVIGIEGEMVALQYMQRAEGLGLNAQTVVADDPMMRAEVIAEKVAAGVPVYITREVEGIETRYSFSGAGPLVRVWPRGKAAINPPIHSAQVMMVDNRLLLEWYNVHQLAQASGTALQIALYWRPLEPLDERLKVSLRLLGMDGQPLRHADGRPAIEDRFPLRLATYSDQWVTEELIRDVHVVPIPSATMPTTLQVIVYNSETIQERGQWVLDISHHFN